MAPYSKAKPQIWWNTAVARTTPQTTTDLYRKRFALSADSLIATAGSCFAQHLSRHLRQRGFRIFEGEPAPFGMGEATGREFGYGIYSCRYGNIYHVRQLLQLMQEAETGQPRPDVVWEHRGRYYDALRPSVEPKGLDSAEEVLAHRAAHLQAVMQMLRLSNVFVFTMGLTEAWLDSETGLVFPVFPGSFNAYQPERHVFHNFRVSEIVEDFNRVRELVLRINPAMKFIVTVSPVPLIATATDQHVLAATTASKSILRAAAQELYDTHDDIDYFPSYEIIASPWSRGAFFAEDLRNVTEEGVSTVMRSFFLEHGSVATAAEAPVAEPGAAAEDVVCEEVLLQAFQQ